LAETSEYDFNSLSVDELRELRRLLAIAEVTGG
jgi:hypothetical protein